MGGFDAASFPFTSEDRELCDHWLHHGYRITYAPEALVYHTHALTFCTFWRQHFNYGRGAFHLHQVRASRGQNRIKLESLSVYVNLLRYPFLRAWGWRVPFLAVLLVVSQVANAAGFVWEGVNRKGTCEETKCL
jgi:GT2 family glycosyltransferase